MNQDALKSLTREILTAPFRYDWTVQGFGMLRCYLPGDVRLNIWDANLMYDPKPSMIHDHPWDFRSVIIAGELSNRIYEVGPETWSMGMPMWERRLKPGMGTQKLGDDKKVVLRQSGGGIYGPGQSYSQKWNEVHETSYLDGTITINFRSRGDRPDVARVYYAKDSQWETAEPRKASKEEVAATCGRSLEFWFQS